MVTTMVNRVIVRKGAIGCCDWSIEAAMMSFVLEDENDPGIS